MTKETYRADTPNKLIFGDPLYFQQYKGERLANLIVNLDPPKHFDTRVVLEEFPCEELPELMLRTMSVYFAPAATMDVYLSGMMYESQDVTEKGITVDSAAYRIRVGDREEVFKTGGDGYWGNHTEYSRSIDGKKLRDATITTIYMPDDMSMDDVRGYMNFFFENTQQIDNVEIPSETEETSSEAPQMNM